MNGSRLVYYLTSILADRADNLTIEEPLWDKKKVARTGSKFPKRLPHKFSVSITLPLTAADTHLS